MCKTSSQRTGWSGEPLMMKISAGKPLSRWSRTSKYGPWKSLKERVTFTPLQSGAKPLQFHFARYRETESGRENRALIHTESQKAGQRGKDTVFKWSFSFDRGMRSLVTEPLYRCRHMYLFHNIQCTWKNQEMHPPIHQQTLAYKWLQPTCSPTGSANVPYFCFPEL